MTLELSEIRRQFPSLQRQEIFLDNPGGTQITQKSIERFHSYLLENNANQHGAYRTSRASDRVLSEARQAMADFLNATHTEEIIFGPNMTTLTFNISRSLAQTWKPGDEIIVTRLDHDANITPWVIAARERDCQINFVDFNPENGVLNLEELGSMINPRTRLLAVGYASNALGTINPLQHIIPLAHSASALVYVDAVHYAPHGPIDVRDLNCDFLVCSAYKFFGPHLGILYGRYELLESLPAYQVRPAPQNPPGKFETGTKNHEGIAGLLGTLEYLQWLGETYGGQLRNRYTDRYAGRTLYLKQALEAVRTYEFELSRMLLDVLAETPGVKIFGPTDSNNLHERVPTFSFTLSGWHPRQLAEQLGKAGINTWDGNYYALEVTERLGLEGSGGMLRVGAVHYNTPSEIERFAQELSRIAASKIF